LFVIDREYHFKQQEAELAWTRSVLAEIEAGRLDGMQEWQAFHAAETVSAKR
jgi:hypothetical protein